jgi:hypothetical protein
VSGRYWNTSVPITMPSTMAIRMYCVNLLDISKPLKTPADSVWQILKAAQQPS